MNSMPDKLKLGVLERLCEGSIEISTKSQNKDTDWIGVQSSLVFAKLCATCLSILRLVPGSHYCIQKPHIELWDLSSVASLCRNLMETYYVLHYLTSTPQEGEEAEFRIALWEYHKEFERLNMLTSGVPNSRRLPEVQERLGKAKQRLEKTVIFKRSSRGDQNEILKAKDFKRANLASLAQSARISESYHRAQYRYCSAFSHSAPFSISHLDGFKAATPDASKLLENLVELCVGYMVFGIRDFTNFFPDAKADLPSDWQRLLDYWETIHKWEENAVFSEPPDP